MNQAHTPVSTRSAEFERIILRLLAAGWNFASAALLFPVMTDSTTRRLALSVGSVLAADAALHLYWATGATWPAADPHSLSFAVLDTDVPFTPPVLLPLAALLLVAAGIVIARSRVHPQRRFAWLLQVGTVAVAIGLVLRGAVGLIWAIGIGVETGGPFVWLNRLVYTPLCLALFAATWAVARRGRPGRGWMRGFALGLSLLLTGVLAYLAFGYRPSAQLAYQPPAQAGERFVDTRLARFHYVQAGSGTPIVLLSPGAAWTYAWHPQLEALSREHTVYVVDLPGQGFTQLHEPDFAFDLPAMTGAIDTFLDAAGVQHAAFAGNSWSGGWALAYAQIHPQRVDRLVLLAPSGLAERDPLAWEALKIPLLGEAATNLSSGDRNLVRTSVRDLFVHSDLVTDEVVDAMWAPGTFPDNLRSMYLLERGLDWRVTQRALPRTRTRTLIIWGERDTVLPVTQAARFGALMPAATVHVLPQCGHALTLDCPDLVTRLMEEFLA